MKTETICRKQLFRESINDAKNSALYEQYKALAEAEGNVIFGGRLGEYKYYDMDKTIEVALAAAKKELS